MKRQTLKTLVILLSLVMCLNHHVSAQQLAIDFIELSARNVVVHYTLDDGANSNRQFLVQLYSSQDNYSTALTRVAGDFGTEVAAGVGKKIVWDITKELGATYKGDISLEVRGRVYVPFVKIQDIKEDQVFKRGKNYPLNWTSGNLSGQVNIELFNTEGERLWGENNVSNVGKFDWYLPTSIKKGNDYKLKFTNAKDRNDVVFSQPFVIKPKIPLLVKVGGVVLVAAAVQFALTSSKAASQEKPLPDPSAPPN